MHYNSSGVANKLIASTHALENSQCWNTCNIRTCAPAWVSCKWLAVIIRVRMTLSVSGTVTHVFFITMRQQIKNIFIINWRVTQLLIHALFAKINTVYFWGIFLSKLWPVSMKTRTVHTSTHIEKKKKSNLKINCEIIHATGKCLQRLTGPAIRKRIKLQINKNYIHTILLTWLWRIQKNLFHLQSLNDKCVMCVCLQCSKRKQNCYHFLGKTTPLD